jgi:hypothetical protein
MAAVFFGPETYSAVAALKRCPTWYDAPDSLHSQLLNAMGRELGFGLSEAWSALDADST